MRKQLLTSAAIMLAATTLVAAQSTRDDDRQKKQAQEQTQQKDIDKERSASPEKNSAQVPQAKPNDNASSSSKSQPSSTTGANNADTNKADTNKANVSKDAAAGSADKKPAASADNNNQRSTNSNTSSNNNPAPNATDPNSNRNADSNRTTDTNKNVGTTSNTDAQRPNTATATNTNDATVSINRDQETKISAAIHTTNVRPVTNVNFSVSVGSVVPTSVELHTLPTNVVSIVPQYRGYRFFVVRDEIVIVEPSSKKIVTVISRSGTQAAAPERARTKFTSEQRETIRKSSRPRITTGSSQTTTQITVGQRLPDTVEMYEFDADVVRVVPSVRTYRYVPGPTGVYLVDPTARTVIEEID